MYKGLAGRARLGVVLSVLGISLLAIGGWAVLRPDVVTGSHANTGVLERMVVSSGTVTMDLDLALVGGRTKTSEPAALRFTVNPESFLAIQVYNGELRAPMPGTMELIPVDLPVLPDVLAASYQNLAIERMALVADQSLVVRDRQSGFTFFNVEGANLRFDPTQQVFTMTGGRLLITQEFADLLGRPEAVDTEVGTFSTSATMRTTEVTQLVDGERQMTTLPPSGPEAGTRPGPDVVVGLLTDLEQFNSNGTMVGLAVGTDSCNFGIEPLHWFANPNNDHPVIPQNLYRMSGGASNDRTIEQIGQSFVKHAFTALQQNQCSLGCQSSGTGTLLGSGCSDPYSSGLNEGPNLGSRAFINPFTGFYPSDGNVNNNHSGHSHTSPAHNIRVNISDLNTTLNPGATYYAEAQYITPHEYAWCQTHPGQCNQYNNASYRRYTVNGTTSFSFGGSFPTVREQPAINVWPGATRIEVRPDPGNDGIAIVAYKVTNPSAGVWHYEYAIYNQNLDRAISSLSIPVWNGVTYSNFGFHAPPQHPGWTNDGTVGNLGFSGTPWAQTQTATTLTWASESFAQNQNANAIRWGTMYNIRFDSSRPPMMVNATMGFLKAGSPVGVAMLAPSPMPGTRPCYARQPPAERCAPPVD